MQLLIIQILAILISLILFWIFFTIVNKIKNRNERSTKWVTLCPRCGSIDVERLFLSGKADNFWKIFNPVRYKCNSCNFEGIFPEADIERIEDIRKSIKKNPSHIRPSKKI